MKVTKITIVGMHKVANKTYDLNKGVTYFVGENGAGKSTILEAIQLALLGYIPGYSKTNEAIMKHASGPVMYVQAYLDSDITITRTWTRSGSSVQSKLDITGYEGQLSDLIGEIDLPVFDFNEFKSMTANKLKDWFIQFLPQSDSKLNLKKELKEAIGSRAIGSEYLIQETEEWAKNSGLLGIELIRRMNDKFKEDQSYVKGQISKLQGTIQSLVRYDDADDIDETAVRAQIDELNNLKTKLITYQAQKSTRDKALAAVESLKKELPAERIDDDTRIVDLKNEIEELNKKTMVLKADYGDLQDELRDLYSQKAMLPKAGSTCPYTGDNCPAAAALAEKSAESAKKLDEQIAFKQNECKECGPDLWSANDRKMMQLNAQLGTIQSSYDRLVAMQLQLENTVEDECPTDMNVLQIDEKIRRLQDSLIQAAANQKYDELSDKVTADKFKLENELEVYKLWDKLTGPNGLQTRLMNKPFEDLADDISKYLSTMFNREVKAKFNLESKANSFSFGIERDSQYIEFDYLSSGERCLFTLALILCILNKSQSQIRSILIDDILDHLDTDNASYLFTALTSISDVQFIIAGVKECSDPSICISV